MRDRISYLNVLLGTKCNLKCDYCYLDIFNKDRYLIEFDEDNFKREIKKYNFKDTFALGFLGG